MIFIHSNW